MSKATPLDHGQLNVPLHKRGNIDRDIDKYKAQQAKSLAAVIKERNRKRREAIMAAKDFSARLLDLAQRSPDGAVDAIERLERAMRAPL